MLGFLPCFREEDPEPARVLASLKDLLVCCESLHFQSVYYICNPLTEQWMKLPPAPSTHEEAMVNLVCYPHTNGSYSYKLARFPGVPEYSGFRDEFSVEIFCSDSWKWSQRLISSPRNLNSLHCFDCPVLLACRGILHWVNFDQAIVSFEFLRTWGLWCSR